ncbi:MAG: hypothetical protein QF805_27910 [Pirellulaceae bacterium]|nr:hypothetical protein [Pirellulaceae bacterium]
MTSTTPTRPTLKHPYRYTRDQILCGLKADFGWSDEVDESIELPTLDFEGDLEDELWDEDVGCLITHVEEKFGVSRSVAEWRKVFGFELVTRRDITYMARDDSPSRTLGTLLDFIAEGASPVIFQPTAFAGRPCAIAGAFMGLRDLLSRQRGCHQSFGPSTPILDVVRGGELERFWNQVHWMTQKTIPATPWYWSEAPRLCGGLVSLVVCSIFAGQYFADSASAIHLAAAAVSLIAVVIATTSLFRYFTNPLPSNLVTFRDLATVIAESGCDAVADVDSGSMECKIRFD